MCPYRNCCKVLTNLQVPSPYEGLDFADWDARTAELVVSHPLNSEELVEIVLGAWDDIFVSSIGAEEYTIGRDIFPTPQIMAFLLHELIPLKLQSRYPGVWRKEQNASEKDLVHVPNDLYSVEIKASSNKSRIYGNRSYAQQSSRSKKSKTGYYLAVNFQKFTVSLQPKITLVRFGWLDHDDWTGQKAPTGQQASLSRIVENAKLAVLYAD